VIVRALACTDQLSQLRANGWRIPMLHWNSNRLRLIVLVATAVAVLVGCAGGGDFTNFTW
jgi:hypothetical protein